MASSGRRPHLVTVQNSAGRVPDGDGGYIDDWQDATPATWFVEITPASARDLERLRAGTTIANATHIVRGPWRPDVNTLSRLLFDSRVLSVASVQNTDEADIDLILICVEVVA
jgi:head-tail adaptor